MPDIKTPSRLEFLTVNGARNQIKKDLGLTDEAAFTHLVVSRMLDHLDLSDDEIIEAVIDQGGDCAIDAFYIDEESSENRPVVHLFNFKHKRSEKDKNEAFPTGEIQKMFKHVSDLFVETYDPLSPPTYVNKLLNEKMKHYIALTETGEKIPKFKLIFCSNAGLPNRHGLEAIDEFLKQHKKPGENFSIEALGVSEVARLIQEEKPSVSASIKLDGPYMITDEQESSARVLIGRLPSVDLAELRETCGKELFDKNIREFIGITTKNVNRDIADSAKGSNAPNFYLLNNGITIVCKKFAASPGRYSPTVKLEEMQIVNGGQTTNTIWELHRLGQLNKEASILIKIIESADEGLLEQIPATTNNQTKVTNRDLKSNDHCQKLIEAALADLGYFYEVRKNKYQNKPKKKRVDGMRAAQAHFAMKFKNPHFSKNKRAELFGDFYDLVFSEETLHPEEILAAFLVHRKVTELNRQAPKDSRRTFGLADYHIVALMPHYGVQNLEHASDEQMVEKAYKKIVSVIQKGIKEEQKKQGEEFDARRYFIRPSTVGELENLTS